MVVSWSLRFSEEIISENSNVCGFRMITPNFNRRIFIPIVEVDLVHNQLSDDEMTCQHSILAYERSVFSLACV